MIYLCLAVISSSLVSIVMRLGEGKIKNNMAMFISNYIVCSILSFLFSGGNLIADTGSSFPVFLGIITGILYLGSFMLLQYNIKMNGVVLSATFMKLGVIIPTLMAIIVFGEAPKLIQIIGMILAIAAIVIINFEKEDTNSAKYKLLLIILLFGSGFADSMANIFDKLSNNNLKDLYLFTTFAVAGICSFIIWLIEKQGFSKLDILFGLCIGIPNYFSSRFLLGALNEIPAMIVYPLFSVLTIVVISVVSLAIFKEKLSNKKCLAIGVILVSLILLNI